MVNVLSVELSKKRSIFAFALLQFIVDATAMSQPSEAILLVSLSES